MTTPNEAHEAIYARIAASYSDTPFYFDGEDKPAGSEVVEFKVRTSSRAQDTLGRAGSRRWRSSASLEAEIRVAPNGGRRRADTISRSILNLFEGSSFSGLDFTNGVAQERGVRGDDYIVVVDVTFDYDETK